MSASWNPASTQAWSPPASLWKSPRGLAGERERKPKRKERRWGEEGKESNTDEGEGRGDVKLIVSAEAKTKYRVVFGSAFAFPKMSLSLETANKRHHKKNKHPVSPFCPRLLLSDSQPPQPRQCATSTVFNVIKVPATASLPMKIKQQYLPGLQKPHSWTTRNSKLGFCHSSPVHSHQRSELDPFFTDTRYMLLWNRASLYRSQTL